MKVYGYCPYEDLAKEQPLYEQEKTSKKRHVIQEGVSEEKLSKKARAAAKRKELRNALLNDPAHPRHGTNTAYQAGCRCSKCSAARRAYYLKYQARQKRLNEKSQKDAKN